MKGKRISTKIYYKYMGEYLDKYGINMKDLRSFKITEIEITDIIEQRIFDNSKEYKIGDIVSVCEYFTVANEVPNNYLSETDIVYYETPINDKDNYLLYLKLPIEVITVGSEFYGYNKIENTFICEGSFELNEKTKTFTNKEKTKNYQEVNYLNNLYPEINEKYLNIPMENDVSTVSQ